MEAAGSARVPSPSGAAREDRGVQAGYVCFADTAVQATETMPLRELLLLLEEGREKQRLLDDLVEGGGSPSTSTGTVASNDAVARLDTPPDVGRHYPARRSASCPDLQRDSGVSCSSVPHRVSGSSAVSSPVPRSPVVVSSPSSAPRPCVPVVDSAAAEPEWTPSGGGRMPFHERDRGMRQGRCLYCAERGHFISDCPIRPPFSQKYGQ